MFVSEVFAIASACCIAITSMFLAELKGRMPLFQLARWQMGATFVMTGIISVATGGWRTVGPDEFWLLAGSSLVGIAIASTTYFATIYTVGPRITALLFSLTSPFALALGYLVLGETIGAQQGLGVVLVLAGVVLAIGMPRRFRPDGERAPPMRVVAPATMAVSTPPAPPVTGRLWFGVGLGVVTAFGQAVGTLLARPAMAAGVEPFTAMSLRAGLATIIFLALAATPFGKGSPSALKPPILALVIVAAFLGTTLGMSFLMAALQGGSVGIVSTLSSLTPVLVLPLVWIRTRERPAVSAWIGALLAIAGTALISLGR